eukprot:TRINITY_DN9012_c0_g1_i1.p1 TRINITY_DN9012_c0_g1~~TRINITY_DN9012_c0_g1_i1.p1  ORF type:complete len:841 (+),score=220.70 TRINITY_DN9012_c0_g1_i1:43-2565(+)
MDTVTLYDKGVESLYEIRGVPEGVKAVHLHMNNVSIIDFVEGLCSVEEIDLSSNLLTGLEGLERYENLAKVNVSANRLKSIPEGLGNLHKLKRFTAAYNLITDIRHVFGCRNLEILELEGNQIAGFDQLEGLHHLAKLKKLNLTGNPVTAHTGYRAWVLRSCPMLCTFDGVDLISTHEDTPHGDAPLLPATPVAEWLDESLESSREEDDAAFEAVSTTKIDKALHQRRGIVQRKVSPLRRLSPPSPQHHTQHQQHQITPAPPATHPQGTQTLSPITHSMEVQTSIPTTIRSTSTSDLLDLDALLLTAARHTHLLSKYEKQQNDIETLQTEAAQLRVELRTAHQGCEHAGKQKAIIQDLMAERDRLEGAASTMNHLERKMERLTEDLERKDGSLERVRSENHKLVLQVAALKEELHRRDADCETIRAELRQRHTLEHAGWGKELKDALDEQAAELRERHNMEITALKRRLESELVGAHEAGKHELALLKRRHESELHTERVEHSMKDQQRVKEADLAAHAQETEIKSVKTSIARKYEKAIGKLTQAYKDVNHAYKKAKEKAEGLEGVVSIMKREHEASEREAGENALAMEAQMRQLKKAAEEEAVDKEKACRRMEEEVRCLRTRPEHPDPTPLQRRIFELETTIREKDSQAAHILQDVDDARAENENLKQALDEERALRSRLETNLQASMKDMERDFKDKKRRLDNTASDKDEKAKRYQGEAREAKAKIEELSEDADELRMQLKKIEAKVGRAEAEKETLARTLSSLERDARKKLRTLAEAFTTEKTHRQELEERLDSEKLLTGTLQKTAESDKQKNKALQDKLTTLEQRHLQLQNLLQPL